ncbi:MAG: hypothetical protein ACI9N9_001268, partial [Enterobacterales bacterium]
MTKLDQMNKTEIPNFKDDKILIDALLKNDESAFRYLVKTMYIQLLIV